MSRWTRLATACLARVPDKVLVRCGTESAYVPRDVLSPEQGDGTGGTVRGVGYVCHVPAASLPSAVAGVLCTARDADGVVTSYRVRERYPIEDGAVHVLVLVEA